MRYILAQENEVVREMELTALKTHRICLCGEKGIPGVGKGVNRDTDMYVIVLHCRCWWSGEWVWMGIERKGRGPRRVVGTCRHAHWSATVGDSCGLSPSGGEVQDCMAAEPGNKADQWPGSSGIYTEAETVTTDKRVSLIAASMHHHWYCNNMALIWNIVSRILVPSSKPSLPLKHCSWNTLGAIILILQMKTLRFREGKRLAQKRCSQQH